MEVKENFAICLAINFTICVNIDHMQVNVLATSHQRL